MLNPEVMSLLKTKGFQGLSEAQLQTIPIISEKKDVLLIAPTGAGKTEAAVLPILSRILDAKKKNPGLLGIQALYITPLRALNRDLMTRLEFWCKLLGITISVRHGDTPSSQRAKQRDLPPNFLITTPETLQSLLIAPKLSDSLKNLEFVVVDEVHELIDSKRGAQLSLGIARLKQKASFQVVGLSATVGNEALVASFLGPETQIVKIALPKKISLKILIPSKPAQFLGLSKETSSRLNEILSLLDNHGRALIFVNTRYTAESLASLLMQVPNARESIAVHHSSLSKESRLEVETEFKKDVSKLKAIICTSSLELGIDVGAIDLVIQYVSPRQASRLLQRVGRSGHTLTGSPKGVIISTDALDALEAIALTHRALNGSLEDLTLQEKSLDVLAQNLAGLAMEKESVSVTSAFAIVKSALPFTDLTKEELESVLRQMHSLGTIFFDGVFFSRNNRTKFYYYENVSTIPDSKRFFVKDANTRKNVGVLDEAFVSEYVNEGQSFITRGRAWKTLSIEDTQIIVEPIEDFAAAIPDWVGQEIPVELKTTALVQSFFLNLNQDLIEKYCNAETALVLHAFIKEQRTAFEPKNTVFEINDRLMLMHSFAGNKTNESLARVLGAFFSSNLGSGIKTVANSYGVLFEFPRKASKEKISLLLETASKMDLNKVLDASLKNTFLYYRLFSQVAKRFGAIKKTADYSGVSLKRIARAFEGTVIQKEALSELKQDYFDLITAEKILLREKTFIETTKWSPLAQNFFGFGGFAELFVPAEPTQQVIAAFKKDLQERRVRLKCSFCNKTFVYELLSEKTPVCFYCESKRVYPEKASAKESTRIASLVSAYGKKALIALETYGVGSENAARVLSRLHKNEEVFYMDLLEAQKTFMRTKKYWKI
ncbi:MAG: DEAD/DEAH box helicase [Candidatus Micrarchaeota archaeon]